MIKSLFKYKRIRNASLGFIGLSIFVSIVSLVFTTIVPILIFTGMLILAIGIVSFGFIFHNLIEFFLGDRSEK